MHYILDVDIATKYDVNVAIFLHNIAFWTKTNIANEKHFHDGRYWTYNSVKAFSLLFPFWSEKQIRVIIARCIDEGLLIKGNYNEAKYDKTAWYALTEIGLKLFNLLICPNGQMELPEKANGVARKGKPIPDNKPDNKPDKRVPLPISNDFHPTQEHESLCSEYGLDLTLQLQSFIAWASGANKKSEIKKQINWNLTFSNWLRNSIGYGHGINPPVKRINEMNGSFYTKDNKGIDGRQFKENRCTVKFWAPGNPDYDRVNGTG